MDRTFYIFKMVVQADHMYYKIKNSREEIQEKHPQRTDLIESMLKSEHDALELAEFVRLARDEWGVYDKTLSSVHLANIKLEAEVRELKKLNATLLEKVSI